jgi:hypothetical protein
MKLFNSLFKSTPKPQPKTNAHRKANVKPKNIAVREQEIINALSDLSVAVHARTIARHLKRDSSEITPRMPRLVLTGRVVIAYRKKGMDKRWRNFYKVANTQELYLQRLEQDKT